MRKLCCFITLFFFLVQAADALAQNSRARVIAGTPPVNVNIAGAGSLPQGVFFSALNASFADKDGGERGYAGPKVFSQAWLLKLRYGLTSHLELSAVVPYVNLSRRSPTPSPKHLEGLGDITVGLNFAPFNLHQRDPFALSFVAAALLPTGPRGHNHLPGNGAWGARASAAFGLFVAQNVKFDTEAVYSMPFERGNQKVERGGAFQWNAQLRHVWDNFDIGLESSYVRQESGEKDLPSGSLDLRNGYSEWFVGPSCNVAIPKIDAWAGLGVFFPVHQSFKGPAASEDYRVEFKFGKLW